MVALRYVFRKDKSFALKLLSLERKAVLLAKRIDFRKEKYFACNAISLRKKCLACNAICNLSWKKNCVFYNRHPIKAKQFQLLVGKKYSNEIVIC